MSYGAIILLFLTICHFKVSIFSVYWRNFSRKSVFNSIFQVTHFHMKSVSKFRFLCFTWHLFFMYIFIHVIISFYSILILKIVTFLKRRYHTFYSLLPCPINITLLIQFKFFLSAIKCSSFRKLQLQLLSLAVILVEQNYTFCGLLVRKQCKLEGKIIYKGYILWSMKTELELIAVCE